MEKVLLISLLLIGVISSCSNNEDNIPVDDCILYPGQNRPFTKVYISYLMRNQLFPNKFFILSQYILIIFSLFRRI